MFQSAFSIIWIRALIPPSIPTRRSQSLWLNRWLLTIGALMILTGCGSSAKQQAGAQPQPVKSVRDQALPAVDAAIAGIAPLKPIREYTGTTQPVQEVSLRSQVEGQVLQVNARVGDRVQRGQALVRVDASTLAAAVTAAESELAARQAEVTRLQAQVREARTQSDQARMQLQQARTKAERLERLARDGAAPRQQAEAARAEERAVAQELKSAQEQIVNQQQAIAAAQGRVVAQQAFIAQSKERKSYAVVNSPIRGFVLETVTDVGTLVQPGAEILKLGDFSSARVTVQVPELELADIQVGEPAQIRLDALPKQEFSGTVSRISPAVNPTSGFVPVEVTVPNPEGRISVGRLARVTFEQRRVPRVMVPVLAVQAEGPPSSPPPSPSPTTPGAKSPSREPPRTRGTLFVVLGEKTPAIVTARSVLLGEQANGKTEVLSGLKPGERFIIRSSRPLQDGEAVRVNWL